MTLQKIVESFIRENGTNQENYENNLAANENKDQNEIKMQEQFLV